MVEVLGGLLVFALFVIVGLWATVRIQRIKIKEQDKRIAAMVDYVPPRAVQFVVDPVAAFGLDPTERATEPGERPTWT